MDYHNKDSLPERALEILKKDYVAVSQKRIKPWQAWLAAVAFVTVWCTIWEIHFVNVFYPAKFSYSS